MSRKDRETLDMLTASFREGTEKMNIPDSLSPDNIKEKLKGTKVDRRAGTIIVLRRCIAAAACLIVVLAATILVRAGIGNKSVSIQKAFDSLKIHNLVKTVSSDEDLDTIISEIYKGKDVPDAGSVKPAENTTEAKNGILSAFGRDDDASTTGIIMVENAGGDEDSFITQAVNSGDSQRVADTVKSSGNYMFIVSSDVDSDSSKSKELIRIVRVSPAQELEDVGTIQLSDSSSSDETDECLEIYLSGTTLVALMERSTYVSTGSGVTSQKSIAAEYYDISEPEAPVKTGEVVQEGSFMNARLSGGRLYIVTAKAITSSDRTAIPTLTVNGTKVAVSTETGEYIVAENAKEKEVLLITAADISKSGKDISKLAILGCGSKANVAVNSGNVYITRVFASTDTDEKRTEIYSFALSSGKFAQTGTYSFKGSPVGTPSVSDEGIYRIITTDGKNLSAVALNSKLTKTGSKDSFASYQDAKVTFIGSRAYVACPSKTYIISFADASSVTCTETTAVTKSTKLFLLGDGTILGITSPNSEGTVKLVTMTADGNRISGCSIEGARSAVLSSDSRSLVQSRDGTTFGVPVIFLDEDGSGSSAYVLFSTESGSIENVGVYNHDENYVSDAANRAVCQGDVLYTVSNGRIVAFSIPDKEIIKAINY